MDRINHASAPGGVWTNGTPGNPATGTVPQAAWFNDVQEELRNIIVAGGITPAVGDQDQVLSALNTRFRTKAIADDGDAYTLLHSAVRDTGDLVNLYVGDTAFVFARNATWTQGVGWVANGSDPGIFRLDINGLEMFIEHGTISGGLFTKSFTGTPVKAWGKIRTGASPITLWNGSGLGSPAVWSGDAIQVNLTNAFIQSSMTYTVQVIGSSQVTVTPETISSSAIGLVGTVTATGAAYDLAANTIEVGIQVMGTISP